MDYLTIKKYNKSDLPTTNEKNSTNKEFLEFYINDKPLSELLNNFYNQKNNILDSWASILGLGTNIPAEIIKIKRLLGKTILDEEIKQVFPDSCTNSEFQYHLQKYKKEIADPEIIIYGCSCGDYECGGIAIFIEKTEIAIIWRIVDDLSVLKFEFDKNSYFNTLNNRLNDLKKQNKKQRV